MFSDRTIRSAATLIGSLATAILTTSAAAQTAGHQPGHDPAVSDTVTVTADRLPAERDTVGSTVTVVTAAELERRGVTNVGDALRTVPGLEVVRTGGPGGVTSVFLRGGNSAFTLLLIDGVRANSPGTGGVDVADLLVDNIERIEIVRGPQSTLYGSEAIGGVISITTRDGGQGFEGALFGEGGDDDFRRYGVTLRGGQGQVTWSLSASDLETDGVSSASEARGNTETDAHEATNLSAHLGVGFGQRGGRVEIDVRATDSETEIDGFGFVDGGFRPVDDPNTLQSRETLVANVGVTLPITDAWTQTVRVGQRDEELVTEDPDSPFSNFGSETLVSTLATQADVSLGSGRTLIVGAEREEREAESFGNFDEEVDLTSFYGQLRWAFGDRAYLTTGVRNDDHSTFGDETTYRVTASVRAGAATRIHGSFGTGFRAPSLNELYFPFFGNLLLRPETSEGWDLGVEQTFADGRAVLDITWFDNEFEDLIGVDAFFQAINIAAATAQGIELSLRYDVSERLQFAASHTYTETEDLATGLQLARRPENRSVFDLAWRATQRLRTNATWVAVRDRVDVGGAPADDYDRVDVHLRYQVTSGLSLTARGENVLDEDYEEVPGYTSPGVTTAVGLRYAF